MRPFPVGNVGLVKVLTLQVSDESHRFLQGSFLDAVSHSTIKL